MSFRHLIRASCSAANALAGQVGRTGGAGPSTGRRFGGPPYIGVCLLALALPLSAQIIRTETQIVLVDVAVTDKKGNYIQDLEASDFRVWEDGKEQRVGSMSRVTDAAPTGPRTRFTILLFDHSTLTGRELAWAHEVAGNFIDASLAEDHSIAVVSFNGFLRVAQTFTADAIRLKQAVNSQGVAGISVGDDLTTAAARSQAAFAARDALRALENLVQNLEKVPGRKGIAYFTAGFNVPGEDARRIDAVIQAANRSNVAIYPVNVRAPDLAAMEQSPTVSTRSRPAIGQSSAQLRGEPIGLPGTVSGPQLAAAQTIMFRLAEGTGGFVVRQPDDTKTLHRVGQEQNEYYLLGYTPPEGSQGSCHQLRVRVERKDTEWRARKEYCNVTPGDLLSGNPVERELEERAAAAQAGNITASLQLPFFYTGANVARVAVVMNIETGAVAFRREKGKYQASFDILGVATRPDGATGARFSDTVKLEFDTQQEVDRFKQKPYRYATQLDAASGDYTFSIVFRSGGSSFGKVETPLVIEPYTPTNFALSGLALSSEFRTADTALAGFDELLIDDSKKLVANGLEATPAGSAMVDASVQTGFYAEIYEPELVTHNPLNQAGVAIQMRVLGREDREAKVDTGLLRLDLTGKQGNATIPLLQRLPILDLASGLYTLELQAFDTAGRSAKRTLDFEIK